MTTPTLRSEAAGLVRLAQRDLAALFRLVSEGASSETALRDILPAIIEKYGAAGAVLAADWYDDQRDKVGARGSYVATPLLTRSSGTQELIGWALATATDDEALSSLVLGGTQRRIADSLRGTVMQNAVADRAATGWQRVGDGSSCTFCAMLIGRGTVYTEAVADFASHDKCGCSAAIAWSGEMLPVKPYKPSLRDSTDADRARVRDWLASH